MSDQPIEVSVEGIAYREAGHVLMAFLILKGSVSDFYFALPIAPEDRELMIPMIESVSPEGELSKHARPTMSLRSLLTVPLFIFAGFAARRIFEDPSTISSVGVTRPEGRAGGMIAGYFAEFGRDVSGPESKLAEAINDSYALAEKAVREHWNAVEALAQRLLDEGELDRDTAFAVIQRQVEDIS
jgi:hypothetical protein